MSKLFVSKIDNKSFTSEEGLIKHLLSNYSMVDTSEGESIEIYNELKEAFPFADISVTESSLPTYGNWLVKMDWKEYNADFCFYIGEHGEFDYYYMSYVNTKEAINSYMQFIEHSDEIIQKLKNTHSPESVEITQMYEGDMNSSSGISFEIQVKGEKYSNRYEFGDIDEFVNSFKGYFDTLFEGEPVTAGYGCDGYGEEMTIDGIPVRVILERANKVRIEILELKD
ncbi:hypothetical protein [Bacillus sp. UMB0728]|uniref:hypothetical protein n=1 Tax=Bacillus sp. UMB0728 TaxID=2066052 RepID=UPI000C770293|nr:hypothetical protein [Bacillus sp. UMB0728]PLR72276.1 hypothetical protein CYJ37_12020 [Bacillus sp. UMB0728]